MDRNELVQNEVSRIIAAYRSAHAGQRQYPASKAQLARLTELGLIDFMPKAQFLRPAAIGYAEAAQVLAEAENNTSAVFNAYGEGEETAASTLYKLLNG